MSFYGIISPNFFHDLQAAVKSVVSDFSESIAQRGRTAHADRVVSARAKALELAIKFEAENMRGGHSLHEGRTMVVAEKFAKYIQTGETR